MSKMLFGSGGRPPVLPHYSLTQFTRRRTVNMSDDVTVPVASLGFTTVLLRSSQTWAIFLALVSIPQIEQR